MRVEPYAVGSYMHVIKRGARGLDIVRNNADRYRFIRSLYYLNDSFVYPHWASETKRLGMFHRPQSWPAREPFVEIVAYTLMPNHFHLIMHEVRENGMSHFMKKLGQSVTNHANEKYQEQGSIFQGSYRSKTIGGDDYLRYVSAYIMVKNTFELYLEGGLEAAQLDFDRAWDWAVQYPFSSLGDFAGTRTNSPIVTSTLLKEIFSTKTFKSFSRDVVLAGKWLRKEKELE